MPTPYVTKLASKHGMSVDDAEKKWSDAKSKVSKDKYPDESGYYSVVMTVFKKMMGEQEDLTTRIKTMKSFEQFIEDRTGEFSAHRSMSQRNQSWSSGFSQT
jgi:hypothetical protein